MRKTIWMRDNIKKWKKKHKVEQKKGIEMKNKKTHKSAALKQMFPW